MWLWILRAGQRQQRETSDLHLYGHMTEETRKTVKERQWEGRGAQV